MSLHDFLDRAMLTFNRAVKRGRSRPELRLLLDDGTLWRVETVEFSLSSAHVFRAVGGSLGNTAKLSSFHTTLLKPDRVMVMTEADRPRWLPGPKKYEVMQVMGVAMRRSPRSPEVRVSIVKDCVF